MTYLLLAVLAVLAVGFAVMTKLFVHAMRRWQVEEDRKVAAVDALMRIAASEEAGPKTLSAALAGIRGADPDGYLSGWLRWS